MKEDQDTDEEIGLTEEEIKEITGSKDIYDDIEPPSNLSSLGENQMNDPMDNLMEEIDMSDLDDEIETVDFDAQDTKSNREIPENDDFTVLESAFETPPDEMATPQPTELSTLEKDASPEKKIISSRTQSNPRPRPSRSVKTGANNKKSENSNKVSRPTAKVVKKSNKPTVKTEKKSATAPKVISKKPPVPPSKKKPMKKRSLPKRTSKPSLSSQVEIQTQDLKALFKILDEMLAHLPPEKIEKFALSKEYETYFALLKKLEI